MNHDKFNWALVVLMSAGLLACSPDVRFSEGLSKDKPEQGSQEIKDPQNPEDSQGNEQAGGHIPECDPDKDPTPIQRLPTKILFVIDQSGSNVSGPTGFGDIGTDPEKSFRFGAMDELYSHHGHKSYLSWGLISFNGIATQGLTYKKSSNDPIFTQDPLMINQAFQDFLALPDSGGTPYKPSLKMIRQMVKEDLDSAQADTQYLIAFLTDGFPSDYCPNDEKSCPGKTKDKDILDDVSKIVQLAPAQVRFSTVYYGVLDESAATRLNKMAKVGQGQFVDANVSQQIKLEDVLEVPKDTCQ